MPVFCAAYSMHYACGSTWGAASALLSKGLAAPEHVGGGANHPNLTPWKVVTRGAVRIQSRMLK